MNKKQLSRKKRHTRLRVKICGSIDRPRLNVRRSLRNLFVQFIDDSAAKTLLSMATSDKTIKQQFKYAGNTKTSLQFGEMVAKIAKEKGISKIVFDRAGYLYHGRIKTFAEALRKGGLEF